MTSEAEDELLDDLLDEFNEANELANEGSYAEALVAVERLLVTCRELADRDIVPVGQARLRDGRLEGSQPLDARLLGIKGKILSETGRAEEALAPLEEAVYRAPNLNIVWRQKGRVLTQLGRWEEALADFDRALALDASDAYDWHSKAYTLFQLGRYDEALFAIDEAIARNPSPPIVGTKGQIYHRLGRNTEALEWLDRALTEDPDDREHWADKALALHALGRDDEARQAELHAAGK